jgi:hypothetical protein
MRITIPQIKSKGAKAKLVSQMMNIVRLFVTLAQTISHNIITK